MSGTPKTNLRMLHINSNYIYTQLHQNMIEAIEKNDILNNVYVATENKKKSVVDCKKYVHISECLNKIDKFFFVIKQYKIFKDIQKEFDIHNFNCIHAYTLFTDGNCAMKLSKKYNIPYVVAVRNTDINTFFKYRFYLRKRGIKILKNASTIFFLSEPYKKQLFEQYIPNKYKKELLDKTYIIQNGIDDFWHRNKYINNNLSKKLDDIKDKQIKIIYAGRIEKNKNITTTCDAIKKLKERGWKINFVVAGKIKNNAIFEEIKDQIDYKGVLNKEELINYYRESHIFVMPSHKETFGLVYAEAMSQGLPVIYTKGQGFDGQFDEGIVGYSVDDKNAEDIANAIEKIAKDYEKISYNCSANIDKYDWNDIAKEYIKIYSNIFSS